MKVFHQSETALCSKAQRMMSVVDKRCWTIKEASQHLGISASYLYDVRADRRQPSRALLRKIAEVGGVALDWLETGRDQRDTTAPKLVLPSDLETIELVPLLARRLGLSVDEMMVRIARPTTSSAPCPECAKRAAEAGKSKDQR